VSGIDDPNVNASVSTNRPAGVRIVDFIFERLIGSALQQVCSTPDTLNTFVDELFAQAAQPVRDDFKSFLLDHPGFYIGVSWPRDAVNMPMIVVEPQGEQEGEGELMINDVIGEDPNTGVPVYAIPERRTTHIYIGSDDDRLTFFLYQAVKFIVLVNKQRLLRFYDVQNLSVSGTTLSLDETQLPTKGFFRILQLSYMSYFDFDDSTEQAARIASVDMGLLVEAQKDGQQVITPVPQP
jgi:hypothetical protein